MCPRVAVWEGVNEEATGRTHTCAKLWRPEKPVDIAEAQSAHAEVRQEARVCGRLQWWPHFLTLPIVLQHSPHLVCEVTLPYPHDGLNTVTCSGPWNVSKHDVIRSLKLACTLGLAFMPFDQFHVSMPSLPEHETCRAELSCPSYLIW